MPEVVLSYNRYERCWPVWPIATCPTIHSTGKPSSGEVGTYQLASDCLGAGTHCVQQSKRSVPDDPAGFHSGSDPKDDCWSPWHALPPVPPIQPVHLNSRHFPAVIPFTAAKMAPTRNCHACAFYAGKHKATGTKLYDHLKESWFMCTENVMCLSAWTTASGCFTQSQTIAELSRIFSYPESCPVSFICQDIHFPSFCIFCVHSILSVRKQWTLWL